MKKEVSIIIIDGKEYTASKDKKYIEGKEKNYKIEEFQKEKGRKIPIMVAPPETTKEGVVYGFSDEQKFEKWLKENKLDDGYDRHKKILEKARRELSSEKREKIKEQQIKEVKETTEKFEKFLREHNLKPDEFEKIEKLLEDEHDPYSKEHSHTLYLYDATWWQGVFWGLPGDYFFGRWYPDFRYFNCNDKASSLSTWFSRFANLYEHINYGGARLHAWVALADIHTIWGLWLGNRASSAVVF